jgi:hypothetical protein
MEVGLVGKLRLEFTDAPPCRLVDKLQFLNMPPKGAELIFRLCVTTGRDAIRIALRVVNSQSRRCRHCVS